MLRYEFGVSKALFFHENFFVDLRTKLRSLEANGGELCQVIGIKILVLQADSVNGLRLDLRPFEPVSRDFRGLTDSYPV